MERKTVSAIILTLLLMSMLTLTLNIQPIKADWTWTETIYIRADGSVDPPAAPIQRDGDIYTFTDNIFETSQIQETLEIQKDNVIIDGRGFTIQGVMGHGISIDERQNVTIKNIRIVGFSSGIHLYSSSDITIRNNTLVSNQWFGISIQGGSFISPSSSNVIVDNTVTDSVSGMQFHGGGEFYNTIINNNVNSNVIGVQLSDNARYNAFSGNTISNNDFGFMIMDRPEGEENSDNRIFHNNFIDNTYQAVDNGTNNVWDDGHPSGGNFWSDYEEKYPNAEEWDSSGIWDTPYRIMWYLLSGIIIEGDNQDNYPLMEPWTPFPRTIDELKSGIEELGSEGEIDNRGIVKSLIAKLKVAEKLVDKGKTDEAVNVLEGFVIQVQELSGIHITVEAADILIQSAEHILSHL